MLELYTAYTSFLSTSHWSVALLIYVACMVLTVPLAKHFTTAMMEGKMSFPLHVLLWVLVMTPIMHPTAMFSSWVTFGIWTPDSWSWFYGVMLVIWVAMQISIWTMIRSATNEDAS